MTLAPSYPYRTGDISISPFTVGYSPMAACATVAVVTPTSQAWLVANSAWFYPLCMPHAFNIMRLWWCNGSTISTPGNVDVGVFKPDGTLVASAGTTVPSGASTAQYVDITDVQIGRGLYYVGMTASVANVANYTVLGTAVAARTVRGLGSFEMASCAPPFTTNGNPATFAVAANMNKVYMFGIQGYGF